MKEVFIKEGQNTVAKRLRDIPRAVEIMEEIPRIREARAELLEMGQSGEPCRHTGAAGGTPLP